ncbi:MAG: arginine--tRNA ligase [Verrucomicrobia bacterium]|nr:arginine--tRNA ligase [Verrucomicrobiota bacterium]
MKENQSKMPVADYLSAWMRGVFEVCFKDSGYDFSRVSVVTTSNPEFGEYQCNEAMALGKVLRKKPRDVAQEVLDKAGRNEAVEKLEIAGPGFINIHLKSEWLLGCLQDMLAGQTLGVPAVGEGKTVVLDYSSPNVAKPMHIGHIRSTIIGNSLDRIYRLMGYKVVADNHVGDWGTQFGIIIMGYRTFADQAAMEQSPVEELERIYVKSYEQTKTDEEWLKQCRQELVKLQSGDAANVALWKQFVQLSLGEFERIYQRLGVSFDIVRGESYYNEMLKDTVENLEKKGLARESEGATVVFLEEEKLPVCIVRKSDGGFNYAATDLATVASRVREFGPDKIIYVTDERQQGHFRQVFAICRRLGYTTDMEHVWFGLMRLPEGTFSTRQGNVIKLEKMLDEAEARALKLVKENSPEMSEAQQAEIARAVGIGAVKYSDLSQNPQTTITFSWDKALSMDGNSAPYLQYAYARIASVRDKYAEKFPGMDPEKYPMQFSEPIERALAVKLVRFPEVVIKAGHNFKPSAIADYLFDIAQTYSNFYQNVPFLKAPEGLRESRVRLCGITARVLGQGLKLLGIDTPARI